MPRTLIPILAIVASALISAVATCAVRRWARARNFVDKPGGHKGHRAPIALGGGVAVTLAILIPILIGLAAARWLAADPPDWLPLDIVPHLSGIVAKTPIALAITAGAAILCLVGLIDDARPLGPAVKFAIQFLVAAALTVGFDLRLLDHLGLVPSAALSILWIMTLTNSLNFLDNMDGLSSGVAAIAAAVFGVTAMQGGQLFVPTCCWLLVGALLGFLPYNFHPATIFLGDAGSTVIGYFLAVFTILTTFASPSLNQAPLGVVAPLVVMAVPLYDTLSVIYLRRRLRVPIWTGDRRHFSHRLLRRGMGVRQAVLVIWLATLVTALPAIGLPHADWTQAILILGQTVLVVALVALLEGFGSDDAIQRHG